MVLKLRSAAGMAMIWLVTVAGVSATAWVAIDRAGRDVSDPGVISLATPSLGPTVVATTPSTTPTTTAATTAPSPSKTTATTAPAPSPTRSRSPSPSGTSRPSPVSSPTPRDRTVIVTGGQVSVRCTGAELTLRIAQPDNGWRVEVEKAGAGGIEVKFTQGDAEEGTETHVRAVCSAGTPAFTVGSNG